MYLLNPLFSPQSPAPNRPEFQPKTWLTLVIFLGSGIFLYLQLFVFPAMIRPYICTAMSYFPNMIAYMNEWVLDRKQSYRILVDSNLDFGQEGNLVREFLIRNPDVVLDPDKPTAGKVLVSVNRLVGEFRCESSQDRCSYVQLGAVSGCSLFASTLGLGSFTMFFN